MMINSYQHSIRLSGKHTNCDVRHIITDLKKLLNFLSSNLPMDIQTYLSQACGLCVSNHMISTWLDTAVPVRLGDEMTEFRRTLLLVVEFAETLDHLGWSGSEDFTEWVQNCSKIWLGKRKEYCLDWVRNRLASGKLFHLQLRIYSRSLWVPTLRPMGNALNISILSCFCSNEAQVSALLSV